MNILLLVKFFITVFLWYRLCIGREFLVILFPIRFAVVLLLLFVFTVLYRDIPGTARWLTHDANEIKIEKQFYFLSIDSNWIFCRDMSSSWYRWKRSVFTCFLTCISWYASFLKPLSALWDDMIFPLHWPILCLLCKRGKMNGSMGWKRLLYIYRNNKSIDCH